MVTMEEIPMAKTMGTPMSNRKANPKVKRFYRTEMHGRHAFYNLAPPVLQQEEPENMRGKTMRHP